MAQRKTVKRRKIGGVSQIAAATGIKKLDVWRWLHNREGAPPGFRLAIGTLWDLEDAVRFLDRPKPPTGKATDRWHEQHVGYYLGKAEVVKESGLHQATVDRLLARGLNEGRIEFVQLGNGRAYFPAESVRELMAEPRRAGYHFAREGQRGAHVA